MHFVNGQSLTWSFKTLESGIRQSETDRRTDRLTDRAKRDRERQRQTERSKKADTKI